MLIKDKMTSSVEVISPELPVKEAAQKMKDLNIGVLPVIENERLIGIVTDRDITIRSTSEGKDPNNTRIRDIMTREIEYCFEDDNVNSVAKKMEKKQIRRLPVLNHDEKVVGIISLGDFAIRGNKKLACEILENVSKTEVKA